MPTNGRSEQLSWLRSRLFICVTLLVIGKELLSSATVLIAAAILPRTFWSFSSFVIILSMMTPKYLIRFVSLILESGTFLCFVFFWVAFIQDFAKMTNSVLYLFKMSFGLLKNFRSQFRSTWRFIFAIFMLNFEQTVKLSSGYSTNCSWYLDVCPDH